MGLEKITEAQLAGRGVLHLADVPGLPASEMKARFEELVREVVIPAFNRNAEITPSRDEIQDELEKGASAAVAAAVDAAGKTAEGWVEWGMAQINAILAQGMTARNPVTGELASQQAINEDLYALMMRADGLTAAEYAALGLTADEYAALGLTADQYAQYGRILTGG